MFIPSKPGTQIGCITKGKSRLRAAAVLLPAGFVASTLQGIPCRRSLLWTEISPSEAKGKPIWPAELLVTDVLHAWQLRKHSFSSCLSCDGSVP